LNVQINYNIGTAVADVKEKEEEEEKGEEEKTEDEEVHTQCSFNVPIISSYREHLL